MEVEVQRTRRSTSLPATPISNSNQSVRLVWRTAVSDQLQKIVCKRRPTNLSSPSSNLQPPAYVNLLAVQSRIKTTPSQSAHESTMTGKDINLLKMPSVRHLKNIFESTQITGVVVSDNKAENISSTMQDEPHSVCDSVKEERTSTLADEFTEGKSKQAELATAPPTTQSTAQKQQPNAHTLRNTALFVTKVNGEVLSSAETDSIAASTSIKILRSIFERSFSAPESKISHSNHYSQTNEAASSSPIEEKNPEDKSIINGTCEEKDFIRVREEEATVAQTPVYIMRQRWEEITTKVRDPLNLSSSQSSPNLSSMEQNTVGKVIEPLHSYAYNPSPKTSDHFISKSASAATIQDSFTRVVAERNSVKKLAQLFSLPPNANDESSLAAAKCTESEGKSDASSIEIIDIVSLAKKEEYGEVCNEKSIGEVTPKLSRRGSLRKLHQMFDDAPDNGINELSGSLKRRHTENELVPSVVIDPAETEADAESPSDLAIDEPIAQNEPVNAIIVVDDISQQPILHNSKTSDSPSPSASPVLSRHRQLRQEELEYFQHNHLQVCPSQQAGTKQEGSPISASRNRCRSLHPDELALFQHTTADFETIKNRSLSDGLSSTH